MRVGHGSGVAGLKTPGAVLGREAFALGQRLHQRGVQGAAGHSHRAVDDAHILRLCRQQHVLVGLGGIALVGGDKAGGKLHARSAKLCKCAMSAPVYTPPATNTGMAWPYCSS